MKWGVMNTQVIILIIAAVLCGAAYIYVFVNSIKAVLEFFSNKAAVKQPDWWTLIINSVYAFGAYCAAFGISLFITNKEIDDFAKDTNNKVFSFLLAAFIAQILSSLFSQRQFDYQKRIAENRVRADNIKEVMILFEKSLAPRVSAMKFLMEDYEKLIFFKKHKTKKQYSNILAKLRYSTDQKITQFNAELKNWRTQMQIISILLAGLNLSPIQKYLELYVNHVCLQEAHRRIKFHNKKNLYIARKCLRKVGVYHDVIINVLQTLADASIQGDSIQCPSLTLLESFTIADSEGIVALNEEKFMSGSQILLFKFGRSNANS